MYAVVEAGGRQYQLTSGRFVDVDMVAGEPQSEFVFDRVLMIVDGEKSTIGKPVVDGAKVTGKIISHGLGPKLVVYKYRAKKGTRKRTGHRQGFTRIYIDSIKLNDKVLSEVKDEGKKTAPKTTKAVDTEKAAKRDAEKTEEKARAAKATKAAASKKAEAKAEPKKTTKKKEQ